MGTLRALRANSDDVNATVTYFLYKSCQKKYTISAFRAQQKPRARVFKWRQKTSHGTQVVGQSGRQTQNYNPIVPEYNDK